MTNEFSKTYPERFYNMGIAEQNMYGVACGLALSGKTVCASTFAMFASGRAFEIIRNSIGYRGIRFCIPPLIFQGWDFCFLPLEQKEDQPCLKK